MVVGGRFDNVGMVGAPALAANAAFRTGVGLVQILTTRDAQLPVSLLAPCATTRVMEDGDEERLAVLAEAFSADVVAIGPGLAPVVGPDNMLALLFAFKGRIVIDADGLNRLAETTEWHARSPDQVIVTPHAGEMRRLLGGLGIEVDPSDRRAAAEALSEATGAVVVLKGSGTIVTDAQRTYVNRTGHSGMATGGSGDVLTGVVAALVGQGMSAYDAAVLGVYLHGCAGDLAGQRLGTIGVTALDIADALCEAVKQRTDSCGCA